MSDLSRVGIVDVGSNSVRLVVFDGMSRSPAYFYNEKVLCGLGAGLADTGKLNHKGRERALDALHRFTKLAEGMSVATLTAVATAAVREATDGSIFVDQVRRETGLDLQIATGVGEAHLSAKGVLLGWPHASGLVCDIGGASLELARVDNGQIGASETSPLGPLKLKDFHGDDAVLDAHIKTEIETLLTTVGTDAKRLFLVGGSWRALARLDMVRRDYPFHVLHEYRLPINALRQTVQWVREQQIEELMTHTDTSAERIALVPMAARVMSHLTDALEPTEIIISSYGLREGMLYNEMPASMRKLDPLIEACRHMEKTTARFPGFGQVLFEWLRPLYTDRPDIDKRLILAACLLHDTNWQGHPDYRAEMCFDAITRANLGGIDHAERVFLGLAILSRYKPSDHSKLNDAILELLSEDQITDAITLGKAMRLGAMISGAQTTLLDHTSLTREDDQLILNMDEDTTGLGGEVVEKRLNSLARQMGLEAQMVID